MEQIDLNIILGRLRGQLREHRREHTHCPGHKHPATKTLRFCHTIHNRLDLLLFLLLV